MSVQSTSSLSRDRMSPSPTPSISSIGSTPETALRTSTRPRKPPLSLRRRNETSTPPISRKPPLSLRRKTEFKLNAETPPFVPSAMQSTYASINNELNKPNPNPNIIRDGHSDELIERTTTEPIEAQRNNSNEKPELGDEKALDIETSKLIASTTKDISTEDDDSKSMSVSASLQEISMDCEGIVAKCPSIQRLADCLTFYQFIDAQQPSQAQSLLRYLGDDSYPHLLRDYQHILTVHLGDTQSDTQRNEAFNEIHDIVMRDIKRCSLQKCRKVTRNSRNRSRERSRRPLDVHQSDNDESGDDVKDDIEGGEDEADALLNFYVDLLDSIHVYFVHSFDIGYRRRSTTNVDIDPKENENATDSKSNDSDTKPSTTSKTSTMSETRKLKFVDDEQCKVERSDSGFYSFGARFYYWRRYKDLNIVEHEGLNAGYKFRSRYIAPKYADLRAELLENTILRISAANFKTAQFKAERLMALPHAKNHRAAGSLCEDYDVSVDTPMSTEHLLSLVFYTDFDELSFHFSSTFRKRTESEGLGAHKRRNREFAHWSRLLRETVELFGTEMGESRIDIFYHGVSRLIFSSFVAYLGSPTSTTSQLSVASMFATESDGLILELARSSRCLRYFDCAWLSCFGNEDEKLLCGGLFPIHFASIRSVADGVDYKHFVHALTSLDYAMAGKAMFEHSVVGDDKKIVRKLLKDSGSTAVPIYVRETFDAFCAAKRSVSINKHRLHRAMERVLFRRDAEDALNVAVLAAFVNLEEVSVEYDLIFRPTIDAQFLEALLSDLCEYKVRFVLRLHKVSVDVCVIDALRERFVEVKWRLRLLETAKNHGQAIEIAPLCL